MCCVAHHVGVKRGFCRENLPLILWSLILVYTLEPEYNPTMLVTLRARIEKKNRPRRDKKKTGQRLMLSHRTAVLFGWVGEALHVALTVHAFRSERGTSTRIFGVSRGGLIEPGFSHDGRTNYHINTVHEALILLSIVKQQSVLNFGKKKKTGNNWRAVPPINSHSLLQGRARPSCLWRQKHGRTQCSRRQWQLFAPQPLHVYFSTCRTTTVCQCNPNSRASMLGHSCVQK